MNRAVIGAAVVPSGRRGEDGGGIALGRRRFARRQTDLALRHGEAGDRVHQAQDLEILIAEVFRQSQGHVGRLAPFQRRLVGGGHHHHSAAQALLAQRLFHELAHLAATFADQADDHDVAAGFLGQHGQQHRLAHAGAGEDAQPLAPAGGGEDVHGPHAEIQPFAHATARVGRRRRGAQGIGGGAEGQGALAVDGLSEGVDDAAQPACCGANGGGGVDDADVGPRGHALHRAEGHQQGLCVAETDDLGRQGIQPAASTDLGPGSDGQTRQAAPALDQKARHARDLAGHDQRIDGFDGGDQVAQEEPRNQVSGMRDRG